MASIGKMNTRADNTLSERLNHGGFRFTPQRRHVYQVLMEKRDHPTAEEVFIRAKRRMPDISMATVYNCLDALVTCGVVRQVTLDRGAARFCPNMREHCHFYCDRMRTGVRYWPRRGTIPPVFPCRRDFEPTDLKLPSTAHAPGAAAKRGRIDFVARMNNLTDFGFSA